MSFIFHFAFFGFALSRGEAYSRVVDSYLYPHRNLKALWIACTKIRPFMLGMTLLAMSALEIITLSTDNGFVIGL